MLSRRFWRFLLFVFWRLAVFRFPTRLNDTQWQKRLLGGRNLAFHHHGSPNLTFWFPFQYADSLINKTEYLLNITSSDWLFYHASVQMNSGPSGLTDYISDAEYASDYDISSTAPDREANSVIAMQRYLQQFGDVEESFRRKIDLILNGYGQNGSGPDRCVNHIKSAVLSPLDTFFTILRKEYTENSAAKDALSQYAFRLGELLLFVRELSKKTALPQGILSTLCRDIEGALFTLSSKEQEGDSMLRSYLTFIREETMESALLHEKPQ